ncbi:hypothetical protein [Amycolatopsis sp. NPDC051128]|uniref:hypothetical protein n=1 Tax=Amycolatopsis sp. NPDC051128 TaxID=3155412 RepID=UPI00343C294C
MNDMSVTRAFVEVLATDTVVERRCEREDSLCYEFIWPVVAMGVNSLPYRALATAEMVWETYVVHVDVVVLLVTNYYRGAKCLFSNAARLTGYRFAADTLHSEPSAV